MEQQYWLSVRLLEHEVTSRKAENGQQKSSLQKEWKKKNELLKSYQSDLGNEQNNEKIEWKLMKWIKGD